MWNFFEETTSVQLLHSVDQLAAWTWVISQNVSMYQRFRNPFRADRKAGAFLSPSRKRHGIIILNDYGHEYHGWDVIRGAKKRYNISTEAACDEIRNRFKGKTVFNTRNDQPAIPYIADPNFRATIEFIKKPWSIADRDFWQPLGIQPHQLEDDGVYSVAFYRKNNKFNEQLKIFKPPGICYAITLPSGNVKLYQPKTIKKYKWCSNVSNADIGNFDALRSGDKLIITKSYKDHRILRNLGFDAVWVQSEGSEIPEDILKRLIYNYDDIYILYDNDSAGKKAANKLSYKTGFTAFFLEGGKDSAEVYLNLGRKALYEQIMNGFELPF